MARWRRFLLRTVRTGFTLGRERARVGLRRVPAVAPRGTVRRLAEASVPTAPRW